jgi:hypothetical protein
VLVEKSVQLCPLLDYHGQYILKKVAMVDYTDNNDIKDIDDKDNEHDR